MQSSNDLSEKFLKFYRDCKKSFEEYYHNHKNSFLFYAFLFIAGTIVSAVIMHLDAPHMIFLNVFAALCVSAAIVLTCVFIEKVYKKDAWLLVFIIPPLVIFICVGLLSKLWSSGVINALTGVIATFLGFFGVFAGYAINTYNERLNKLDEKSELLDLIDPKIQEISKKQEAIKRKKKKMLRFIMGVFWCICLSLLILFISFNYFDLLLDGVILKGITWNHPYRLLFIAVLFVYYGLLGTVYLILQFSAEHEI